MIKQCVKCGKEFITYPSRIKKGSGKYCSKKCYLEVNGFKKGEVSWNKDKKCEYLIGNKHAKGNKPNKTSFKKGDKGYWLGKKRPGIGGRTWTDEEKKRMSEFKKGKPSPRKGVKLSEETKQKLRLVNLGKIGYWANKKRPSFSIEHRIKIGLANKGEKSRWWRGGVTNENHIIRNSITYRLWREAVFKRDNWTCQKTKKQGGKLEVHHINNFSQHSKIRFLVSNGVTLSIESHRNFHKQYGTKNNNAEQLQEFLNN